MSLDATGSEPVADSAGAGDSFANPSDIDTNLGQDSFDGSNLADDTPPPAVDPVVPAEPAWFEQLGFAKDVNPAQALAYLRQQQQEYHQYQQQLPQLQQYAQLGYKLAPQLDQFNTWQSQQQQPKAEEKPFWSEAWNPPQFDPSLWDAISRINPETGQREPVAGVSPELYQKGIEYQRYLHGQVQELWKNPHEYIYKSPAMQQAKKEWMDEVRQMMSAEVGAHQTTETVDSFEQANSSWLYAQQGGQIARDPLTGQNVMTAAGRMFYDHIAQDQAAGVRDPKQLMSRATQYIQQQAELAQLRQQFAGQAQPNGQQAQPPAAQPQNGNQLAARQANDLAALGNRNQPAQRRPSHANGTGAPADAGMSLREKMALNMSQAGITEF